MFTVLSGEVDAILLTGGIAYNQVFTDLIAQRVNKLAPVHVYPGEDEMKALAKIGARVLKGEIDPIIY
jgi:butyrate kinase